MGQESFKTEDIQGKNEKTKKEGGYNLEEIKELEKPLALVLEKLKANIEDGVYDVLLSDDKGGRIPTLALREIMNKANQETGRGNVLVYFLSAGNALSRLAEEGKEMKEYIKKEVKDKVERRALVVTEYVASGMSIKVLADILSEAGIAAFDVAALVCNRDDVALGEGHQFFSGITPENAEENGWHVSALEGVALPLIYGARISGVTKRGDEPHPTLDPLLKKATRIELKNIAGNPLAFKKKRQEREKMRENVNKAREDVKTLAENAEKALGW